MVLKAINEDVSDDDEVEVDLDELAGFAEHLGLSLPAEQDLMWIPKMALNAPVPAGNNQLLGAAIFRNCALSHYHNSKMSSSSIR